MPSKSASPLPLMALANDYFYRLGVNGKVVMGCGMLFA
jgi:hypothetical protein